MNFPDLDFRPLIVAIGVAGWAIIESIIWLFNHIHISF